MVLQELSVGTCFLVALCGTGQPAVPAQSNSSGRRWGEGHSGHLKVSCTIIEMTAWEQVETGDTRGQTLKDK